METIHAGISARPDAPLLAGRFRLTHCIGAGAQGAVFAGDDLHEKRGVAVKMFDPDRRTVDGCLAEARMLAGLHSPHIVRVLGVGLDDGTPWMAFEHIDGPHVGAYAQRSKMGRLSPLEATRIALGVLEALEECHGQGIAHGGPHHENVVLRPGGEPVLIDFGRAVRVGSDAGDMLARDVAIVGELLFGMLTGVVYTGVSQPHRLQYMASRSRTLLADVGIGAGLSLVALRATAPDPAARYRDAGEMRSALAACIEAAPAPQA